MIKISKDTNVKIKMSPIDMRKSINGLTVIVQEELDISPTSNNIFIFFNKSKDKVKILYWDTNGFIVHYKRLEQGKFQFNKNIKANIINITYEQLEWLLAGLDFQAINKFNEISYGNYY